MSCCVSREEFILTKVRNMKTWLHPWLTPEVVVMYDESQVMGVVASVLMPLFASGKLDDAVDGILTRLDGVPQDEVEAVRTKLKRYLTCFCEAMI